MRIVAPALLCLTLAACAASPGASQNATAPAPREPATAYTMTAADRAATESAIRAALKDPESARFGSMAAGRRGENIVVCGWVNARNSYGGYTGEQRFVAALYPAQGKAVAVGIGSDRANDEAVRMTCAKDYGVNSF